MALRGWERSYTLKEDQITGFRKAGNEQLQGLGDEYVGVHFVLNQWTAQNVSFYFCARITYHNC